MTQKKKKAGREPNKAKRQKSKPNASVKTQLQAKTKRQSSKAKSSKLKKQSDKF
jgi:hypothetical protein